MIKYCTCFFLFTTSFFKVTAQSIDSTLVLYNNNFPQEKIHLHTDRDTYLPGETIWFKAYVLADELPSAVSTNLYADLLDAKGKLIVHKTMPILAATADSYFTLPDSGRETNYTIRAYTSWMLNFDTAFIYHKTITVVQDNDKAVSEMPAVSVHFFPEGGNLVAGLYNYVAFKATQSDGLPYAINAVIKNSKGQFTDSITAVHDGMGMLKFIPETGETYVAEWKDNKGEYRRTPLPEADKQGLLLHTQVLKDNVYYLINATGNRDSVLQLTVVATMHQKLMYQATVKSANNTVNQKFSTKDFPSGILQLTVLDSHNLPLAERIVFINNHNYSFTPLVNIEEKGTGKRANNKIKIAIPDTLSSNLSVAVFDAGLQQQQNGRNIYTDMLLQGDIKGYVHNADWYFNDTAENVAAYLDLVMQTNGWRRYRWDKITAGQLPEIYYPRDNYINIYGKAADGKQQGAPGQMINLIVQTKDSAKQWYLPLTNKEGNFTQGGIIFYDTATVFYKLNNSREKTIALTLAKNYNGLLGTDLVNSLPSYIQISKTIPVPAGNDYTQTFITEIKHKNPAFEQKAKVLNEVVVKSNAGWHNWKNDPMMKMDEKYTTMFRGIGSGEEAFDIMHDEMAAAKLDIYNYMIGKIPGIFIQYPPQSRYAKEIWGPSVTGKVKPVALFLNESPIENDQLENINLDNIAYIKYYYSTAWIQGLPPSISIYTKKADDLQEDIKKMPSNLAKTTLAGYSSIKEYYSPDYSMPKDKQVNADLRTTLFWSPYIITNKESPSAIINFYNNDITSRLKLVLEGMNEEGKLIHIEKIIE